MIQDDAPVVVPLRGRHPPDVGPLAVMVSNSADLSEFCRRVNLEHSRSRSLMMSRIHLDPTAPATFSVTGPVVGAPYAVMLLEPLATWGAQELLFFGWCGAVSRDVHIGDLVLVTEAVVDEGTSLHYGAKRYAVVATSVALSLRLKASLDHCSVPYHQGRIWSTDAIYRETAEKVRRFQRQGVLAVEMEVSALVAAGRHRNVAVAALLVVSDEVSECVWNPGFRDPRFAAGREAALDALTRVCPTPLP